MLATGWGPLFPYKSMKTFDMTWDESLYMFLTGKLLICSVCWAMSRMLGHTGMDWNLGPGTALGEGG